MGHAAGNVFDQIPTSFVGEAELRKIAKKITPRRAVVTHARLEWTGGIARNQITSVARGRLPIEVGSTRSAGLCDLQLPAHDAGCDNSTAIVFPPSLAAPPASSTVGFSAYGTYLIEPLAPERIDVDRRRGLWRSAAVG